MAKILITGGAGLIGSFLLKLWVNEGHNVTVVDDLSRGKAENIPSAVSFIQADASDLTALNLGDFDVIVPLASFMFGLGFSEKNHDKLYRKNHNLEEGLAQFLFAQKKKCRVIFISSSCVYDDNGPDSVDEQTPLGPLPEQSNIGYGFAKRHMEDRLRMVCHITKHDLSIVRPFNIYGETYRWAGDYSQAIPMLVNKIMTSNVVDVWGSGNQKRTYVHASDCAALINRVCFSDTLIPLLNIGHEQTISLNDLTLKIAQLAGRDIKITNNLSKPEGRFIKTCSTHLLKNAFPDYEFKVPLKEGLTSMLDWWHAEVKS